MKILIIAGSNYSHYSQCLIECSKLAGYDVAGVVIRRSFTYQRFKEEFARGGWRVLTILYKKLAPIIGPSYFRKNGWTLYLEKRKFKPSKLSKLCYKMGIEYVVVNDINCEHTCNFVKQLKPDVALFGGGGIIRNQLLEKIPIINCHMGILPEYRGSYPWVWAILNGDIDKIGLTSHLMEFEIDTGEILSEKLIDVDKLKDIEEVETTLEYNMVEVMLEGLDVFVETANKKSVRKKEITCDHGQLYYMPHASLYNIAREKFRK